MNNMSNQERLVFKKNHKNTLSGLLEAEVQFAQSQIIPVIINSDDVQPHLTANRKTLLMLTPLNEFIGDLYVRIIDKDEITIGKLKLEQPDKFPKTAYNYFIDGITEEDFIPPLETQFIINNPIDILKLSDPNAEFLLSVLNTHSNIEIQLSDGIWVDSIYLPEVESLNRKFIRIVSHATMLSKIYYSGRNQLIHNTEIVDLVYKSATWLSNSEWNNQSLMYSENTWSSIIPASWIKPGMRMLFEADNVYGELNHIEVGATTELLMNTIDIGMLTEPRNQFLFAGDKNAHREYFQTIPISRMIVNNYQSLHLKEVMMQNGTLLTDFDPSVGGIHTGEMRDRIGVVLLATGINHANYGINNSGIEQITLAAQITLHTSIGNYVNGIQVHGMSGGTGVATLFNSLGNELSHEVGHCYGLGHYPGEFDGSVHRPATEINSTWGWDMDLNLFIPNFWPNISDKSTCYEGQCQTPFYGRAFGYDPMAGGDPMSFVNHFTLHTPYTVAAIQSFFEDCIHFAPDSLTGFLKWNPNSKSMESYQHRINTLFVIQASEEDFSEQAIVKLLRKGKYVRIKLDDGFWGPSIHIPVASTENLNACIEIIIESAYTSNLHINDDVIMLKKGDKRRYESNGLVWQEVILLDKSHSQLTLSNEDIVNLDLTSLLTTYHAVHIPTVDGYWSPEFHIPPASIKNKDRVVTFNHQATFSSLIYINGEKIELVKGMQKYYESNGERWLEREKIKDISVLRKPKLFGVPVTTIVGYHDPRNQMQSYIYPALHGAYGYIYEDDSSTTREEDYQLVVESKDQAEPLKFRLMNKLFNQPSMNKFHINIPTSTKPREAYILHNGVKIASRTIDPYPENLKYTEHGEI